MSDNIFPNLRGQSFITKTPNWNTIKQKSMSGKKKFLQLYSFPIYQIKMSLNYLRDNGDKADDIHAILGFYNKQGGAANDFLFLDDTDCSVNNQTFGIGDGSTTKFQLCRDYGGFVEPVFGIVMAPIVTISGIPTTNFTWNTKGEITFSTAPASGVKLNWSGVFYFRCHFSEDKYDFQQLYENLWDLQELELESIKP